jgi:hypothetical protein
LTADRTRPRPAEGFIIFDDEQVSVELISGYLKITQPKEVASYVREFSGLAGVAVYGQAARALIAKALGALA